MNKLVNFKFVSYYELKYVDRQIDIVVTLIGLHSTFKPSSKKIEDLAKAPQWLFVHFRRPAKYSKERTFWKNESNLI